MKNIKLKQKIIALNSYSILVILFLFSILNFIIVYKVLKDTYRQEINTLKEEYLSSQKAIMKNQVNNFINFIEHTRKVEQKEEINTLIRNVITVKKILANIKPQKFEEILNIVKHRNPMFSFGLTDTKGNIVFCTSHTYSKKRRVKLMSKGLNKVLLYSNGKNTKYIYFAKYKNRFDNKWYVIASAIDKGTIENKAKSIIIDRISSIKFGAKNNGYLSIAEILNYNGGKQFAKVVALPVKPEWEGKLLDDDKEDAKGKKYRKEYLKIINSSGEGYVEYYFFKKKTKELRPKLSYVKLYKPYNWIIFTSVYIDDINNIIDQKEQIINSEIKQIFMWYFLLSILFFIMAYIITKYENKILQSIIDNYEEVLNSKNLELIQINKNLEKEVKRKTQELLDSILTDPLTKLPNREKLLLDLSAGDYVAILNIDSFKEINDFYGIEVGDLVLKKVSQILDIVSTNKYRLSGDEFALKEINLELLKINVHYLLLILSKTSLKIMDDLNINISISCGIGKNLVEADIALKYAKKDKYEKLVVYNEEIGLIKEYENNIKWKNIIRKAIKQDNILVYVQPIIDVKTKTITKYECLVRLKDDKIYTPYFFLDIAKKTKQYYEIQKIVIKKSFEIFSKFDYKFSINLSIFDLTNHTFKEFLLEKIEQYNISHKLIIEILEDEELLEEEILEFFTILKHKGVEIAIDDFGSGYSNFSYLIKSVPVDILKIDGSLVKNIAYSQKDYKLFKSIVNMAKEFNFKIVAEFVENKEIFDVLVKLDVDYAQGYYFSAPFFDISKLQS